MVWSLASRRTDTAKGAVTNVLREREPKSIPRMLCHSYSDTTEIYYQEMAMLRKDAMHVTR